MQALTIGARTPTLAEGLRAGRIYLPITKVDKARRIVWGVAQVEDDEPDTQNDIVDFNGTLSAFRNWAGNVREMHTAKAVGHAVEVLSLPKEKQVLVGTYVSKGAPDTWEKILDGTLKGYSIGGSVIKDEWPVHKSTGKRYHRIIAYQLDELSLVDTPANSKCIITAVEKRGSGLLVKPDFTPTMGRKAHQLVPRIAADLI